MLAIFTGTPLKGWVGLFSFLFALSVVLFKEFLPRHYIFDPLELQEISKTAIENNKNDTLGIFQEITSSLKSKYGTFINDYNEEDWVFNNAGGAMGSMIVLHCSVSEYLIIFGTAVGTEGHTGVHFADDYFTILQGKQIAQLPGKLHPEVYYPGEQHHLKAGYAKHYAMPGESWALELAQGWIPAMLPFGFLDSFSSTMDFYSLGKTVYISGVNMFRNLIRGKF